MLLKMLHSTRGAEDKINVKMYKKDSEYEINTNLADIFIETGVAVEVKPKKVEPIEQKKVEPVENKMVVPEDKSEEETKGKRKKIKDYK